MPIYLRNLEISHPEWHQRLTKSSDAFLHWGQTGEDIALDILFRASDGSMPPGFYLDVGAFHPTRLSNTYSLYVHGWNGINIDASPTAIAEFSKQRTRDVNICVGIADGDGDMNYYMYPGNVDAANTFSLEAVERLRRLHGWEPVEVRKVPVRRLDQVLAEHVPEGKTIDYINIDLEGFDFIALRQIDFERFRPRVLTVEQLGLDILGVVQSEICTFMIERGYRPYAFTGSTTVYTQVDAVSR